MKTLSYIIHNFKSGTIDGRDAYRLMQFVPEKDLETIGVKLKDEFVGTHVAIPMTRKNILKQLKEDVAFGFKKALDKRGISSNMMYEVVMMWNWILEEGLENFKDYAQYGLPLFKATAVKYGFPNPIKNDAGNEFKYSAEANE